MNVYSFIIVFNNNLMNIYLIEVEVIGLRRLINQTKTTNTRLIFITG